MIQFLRYSDDPVVNATAQRLVNCMAPNPLDARKTNADKTVAVIRKTLRLAFGDFAGSVHIPVH